MEITLEISQNAVLAEVEQKTNYAGRKREENPKEKDEGAYERIRTVDEDRKELLMHWDEVRSDIVQVVQERLVAEGMGTGLLSDTYSMTLKVHEKFNTVLTSSMKIKLFNAFVYGIIARWYMFTNEEESATYADMSKVFLLEMLNMTIQRVLLRKTYPF